jgi:AmmeMemoRadiSam system protein A
MATEFSWAEPSSGQPNSKPVALTLEEKRFLIRLARQTVEEVVTTGRLPGVSEASVPANLCQRKACFVTLTQGGRLRGCIGHLQPDEPLYRAVMENARSAAIHDSRFMAVDSTDLPTLDYEISILTEPRPLAFDTPRELLQVLRPGVDGVVLRLPDRSATFLPQVWEQLPEPEEFLGRLAMKAGGSPDDWRQPGTTVLTYQADAFSESEL